MQRMSDVRKILFASKLVRYAVREWNRRRRTTGQLPNGGGRPVGPRFKVS